MNTFERNAARALAVSYNAYLEASYENKAIAFWASMLHRAQRDTGIELIPVDRLLYPLTGDATLTNVTVQTARASVSPAMIDDDDDGPLPVLSPVPQPRKPSPSAAVSPAAQAAAFFAGRAR